MDTSPTTPDTDQPITITLTAEEAARLRSLLRQAIRKTGRSRRTASARHGAAFDPTDIDRRMETYRALYAKLGGDPGRITNNPLPT